MGRTVAGVVVTALVATGADAQPALPHDVSSYSVVYRVPAMADVVEKRDLPYAAGVGIDLYLPPPSSGPGPWPVVVFANGVGDFGQRRLKNWEIYRSWGRLVAAHGLAAVTMDAEAGRTAERLAQVVEHLRQGRVAGVDGARIALWACSGNVTTALPYALGTAPLRAAVFYYGTGAAPNPRQDLPVFYVLAGKDSPSLNAGIRRAWASAVEAGAPWTMVLAPQLPHAFDALVESAASRDLVKDTLEFLVRQLGPARAEPAPSPARQALIHSFGWEWPQAAAAYAAILKETPDDRDALLQYARALSRAGRGAEAAGVFRALIEKGGDDAPMHLELGNVLLGNGRFVEAVAEYDLALARGGPAGVLNYNAACALAKAGHREEALERLERAITAGFGTRSQYTADEDLASLHGDPRWAGLLSRLAR